MGLAFFASSISLFLPNSLATRLQRIRWRIDLSNVNLFTGIGWASVIIVQFLNIYYIVILGWALFYMFASFTSELPWSRCGNEWNTPNCVDYISSAAEKSTVNSSYVNRSMANTTVIPTMMANMSTVPTAIAKVAKVSASEEYWEWV